MGDRDDAVEALRVTSVLDGIAWAWTSAVRRTSLDYDHDTGHDQVWLGLTAHKLFCDRMDRVFHCGRYAVEPGGELVGLDVLGASLQSGELDAMPALRPGTVVRDDITNSPGWRLGARRWLISSFPFEGVHRISWQSKTPTKQRAAAATTPDDDDGLFPASLLRPTAEQFGDGGRLMVAHSVNSDATAAELYLGRPRSDISGAPWHWVVKLDEVPWNDGARAPGSPGAEPSPAPATPRVTDAEVRLRSRPRTGSGE